MLTSEGLVMTEDFRIVVQRVLLTVGLPLLSAACSGEGGPLDGRRVGNDACVGGWGERTQEGGCFSGPYTKTIDEYLDIVAADEALYAKCVEGEFCPDELCLRAVDYQPAGANDLYSESFDELLVCEPACSSSGQPGVHTVYRLKGSCTGRRPAGLFDHSGLPARTASGAWFAEAARLEAASVIAFARLRRELVAHGAPEHLVSAAKRAMQEEASHARTMRALARRYGGRAARARVSPVHVRPLEAVARENAREGCITEGFGALVGSWQARTSTDPLVRRHMRRIAREEVGHAALAWQVDAWARTQLGRQACRRLDDVQRSAIASLQHQVASAPAARELEVTVGLPDPVTQRRLLDAYARELALG